MYESILSELVITRVHSVSTFFTKKDTKMRRKNRPRWGIVIKYEGETLYTAKGRQTISDISHMVILPKGCDYEWQCTQAGHFSIIEFACESIFDVPMGFPVKNGERFLKMFQELEYKRNLRRPMYEQESIRDVYTILLQMAQNTEERYVSGDKRQKLAPVLTHISQNYGEHISNDMLARIAGMSTVYFRKLFTEEMGLAPMQYVKQLRIEKAKEILGSDYGTLTDVALLLGYSSLYDFSRDFKKNVGVPPSQYKLHMDQRS